MTDLSQWLGENPPDELPENVWLFGQYHYLAHFLARVQNLIFNCGFCKKWAEAAENFPAAKF